MKKIITLATFAAVSMTATLANAADVYVVNFRSNDCAACAIVDGQINSAMNMVQSDSVKKVVIDSTNPLKWEVSANTAFDNNIVPQFNKWVGLTGFAAIIDAKTNRTIGCINDKTDVYKTANFIKKAARLPFDQAVSARSSEFKCPATFNVDPGT